MRRAHVVPGATARLAALALAALALAALVLAAACSDGSSDEARGDAPTSSQDSVATSREVRASIEGEGAPDKQAYSYRGFYAGMTRSRLERRVSAAGEGAAPCQRSLKQP